MKTTIYKIRQPFLCKEGQFTQGQRELCIGLDYQTIKSTDNFNCYIGNNDRILYQINATEALQIGQQWKNPKGKIVLIVPLSIAKIQNKIETKPIDLIGSMAKAIDNNKEVWEKLRKKLHN